MPTREGVVWSIGLLMGVLFQTPALCQEPIEFELDTSAFALKQFESEQPIDLDSLFDLTPALDGYCPVTLVQRTKWRKGNAMFRATYKGRTFFMADEDSRDEFLKRPADFAPLFGGRDIVTASQTGQLKQGKRNHGVFFRNQIVLFENEDNLWRFWNDPQKYCDLMQKIPLRTAIAAKTE